MRSFKGDKWTRAHGSVIPLGALVRVLRFFPRRRALVEYEGRPVLTMLWCLRRSTTVRVRLGDMEAISVERGVA